jgi:hypothetical protein
MFSTVYRIWEVGHCIRCGMCECGCDVCMVGGWGCHGGTHVGYAYKVVCCMCAVG